MFGRPPGVKGRAPCTFRPVCLRPRGVEHCPRAEAEVSLMLFEPAGTVNTGTAGGEMTVPDPERI